MKELEFIDEAPMIIGAYIKDYKLREDNIINYIIECEESYYNSHSRVNIETMFRHRLHGDDWKDCINNLRQAYQGRRKLFEASLNELKLTEVLRLSDEMKKVDKAVKQLRKLIRLGFRRLIQDLLKENLGEI